MAASLVRVLKEMTPDFGKSSDALDFAWMLLKSNTIHPAIAGALQRQDMYNTFEGEFGPEDLIKRIESCWNSEEKFELIFVHIQWLEERPLHMSNIDYARGERQFLFRRIETSVE